MDIGDRTARIIICGWWWPLIALGVVNGQIPRSTVVPVLIAGIFASAFMNFFAAMGASDSTEHIGFLGWLVLGSFLLVTLIGVRDLFIQSPEITIPEPVPMTSYPGQLQEKDEGLGRTNGGNPSPTPSWSIPVLQNNGTVCADGWISTSTGRGTCSHHGGVAGR